MTKARQIISYGGAITEGWSRYAKRQAHYNHVLRLAGRPADDVERVRACKSFWHAIEIIHAENMHVAAAKRLIRASRISRKAAVA